MKHDDAELIERTLEGDQQAFAALVGKYQEQIHALAWQKIGDFHIAQEITQDAFVTAYQKLATLTHHNRFAGWLYVITSNKCNMWHRKKKPQLQSLEETDPMELEEVYYSDHVSRQREEVANQNLRAIVRKLLNKLGESERTVVTMHYLAGLTCEEIGRFLGVSPNTVKSRLHRARERLKKEEAVIQENLSSFQLPTQLTENIMKEISRLNPVTPSGSKPLVPLAVSAASAILVVLLIGFGTQNLIRFQKPYSIEATSEQTVEIVDARIVFESPAKPAVNNQISRSDVLINNNGTGQEPDTSLLAAAQSDDAENSTSKAQWSQTNGPYGGDISTLFATSEGILFAGTDGAGVFRSTDGGESWTPVNTGLHHASGFFRDVTALAQKRDTLYVSMVSGLFESTDNGNTWQGVPEPQWHSVLTTSILVIGDRIYIGTERGGIWYTDDSVSWIPVNDGLTNLEIIELANIGTTFVVGTQEGGVFRKKATEDSWHPINLGFTVPPINQEQTDNAQTESALHPSQRPQLPSKIHVDSLAVMDNLLFVGADWDNGGGLFRSDDEGDTWTRIAAEEITDTVRTLDAFGATLYAGTSESGVFRSDDRGDSWTAVNNGLMLREVLTLLAVNENTVFVGTQDGVFRTTDSGNSWVEINTGLTNTTVLDFEVVGNKIYANYSTMIGGKIVRSIDGGESWQPVTMLNEYRWPNLSVSDGELYIRALRTDPRDGEGKFAGVFRLDEDNNALVELFAQNHFNHTICMETVGTTFYIGTSGGVFRYQWERDSFPEVTNLGLDGHYISMLSVNRKLVYAITGDNEIYRLQDEGRPWERIHLAEDMADVDITGIGWVGSVLYLTSDQGVFSSINGGHTWTSINDGLDKARVSAIWTDGTDLYVGTRRSGVYRWIEDKKRWKQLGSLRQGSLRHQVLSLAVLDGFLYAGTASLGVFRFKIEK